MGKTVKVVLAVLVLAGAAAGISYATNAITRTATSTLQACANSVNGNLRLVSGPSDCRSSETAVSWNVVGPPGPTGPQGEQGEQGPPGPAGPAGQNGTNGKDGVDGKNGIDGKDGANGVSPVVAQLGPNDPNCPTGGVSITDGLGNVGYVCDGAKGDKGDTGDTGPAGQFSGTFKSPNGDFSLTVGDTGIKLQGPSSDIAIDLGSLLLSSQQLLKVQASAGLTLDGGPLTKLQGSLVQVGSASCSPAIRAVDISGASVVVPFQAGGVYPVLFPSNGSPDVCLG